MAKFRRKRFFRITWGGWVFLTVSVLLTLGAVNAGLNMVYLLASLLIAVFALSLIGPFWSTYGLDYRRARCDEAYANEPFNVDLWLYSNRSTVARVLSIEEPLGGSETGQVKSVRKFIDAIRPGERRRVICALPPRRRGAYPLPDLRLSSRFPFGVAERGSVRPSEGELLVFPARGHLSAEVATMLTASGVREGLPSRQGLLSNEFKTVREYRPGDNLRSIHWHASAHLGELVVREWERERSAPLMFMLDSRVPASTPKDARAAAEEAVELAISFACEVCRTAVARGSSVQLLALVPEPKAWFIGAPAVQRQAPGRIATMGNLLEALARMAPSDDDDASSLVGLARSAGVRVSSRIVAVTPTYETARGIRSALAGQGAQLYVTSSSGFESCFRLLKPGEGR